LLCLSVGSTSVVIGVEHSDLVGFEKALSSTFSRRYLPRAQRAECSSDLEAHIKWSSGVGFAVESVIYSDEPSIPDYYAVRGGLPEAYVNESPVFFLLQVYARSLAKRGYVLLTDSVTISDGDKAILLLGYPHTGKSTISSIALTHGYSVLSTENSIVKPTDKYIEVHGGTRVLVFDPRVRELYGVKVESHEKTRHGYEVVDLDLLGEPKLPQRLVGVYLIYTSFTTSGVSFSTIKGRKIAKTIWYFATGPLKGIDYYEPSPLDTPIRGSVANTLTKLINTFTENYSLSFYEVFGSPLEVFKAIVERSNMLK